MNQQYQKILQEISARFQLLNEQSGLNSDIIDTELIRHSNLNDWKNKKEKELNYYDEKR